MDEIQRAEALRDELVRDCIGCGGCVKQDRCVFDGNAVNRLIAAAEGADGFLFGTPVYYAHPSGRILSVLDRAFYAGGAAFRRKPGGVLVQDQGVGRADALEVLREDFRPARVELVGDQQAPARQGAEELGGLAPGAAQRSRTRIPGRGASRAAGAMALGSWR